MGRGPEVARREWAVKVSFQYEAPGMGPLRWGVAAMVIMGALVCVPGLLSSHVQYAKSNNYSIAEQYSQEPEYSESERHNNLINMR